VVFVIINLVPLPFWNKCFQKMGFFGWGKGQTSCKEDGVSS
jgi:hypothetical protein